MYSRLLTENPRLNLTQFFVILSDLLETLQNQRAYPYAEVRRDYVHQAEARDDFEAMDIQLRKQSREREGQCVTACSRLSSTTGFISLYLSFIAFRVRTREFMKMKYICMKVKIICNTGFTPCSIW